MPDPTTSADTPLPRYRCHKIVQAAKILRIAQDDTSAMATLWFVQPDHYPAAPGDAFIVTADWIAKHSPEVGGYFVVYDDGYTSYSPAAAFEAGYRRIAREAFESPDPMLQFFTYAHLPAHLQAVSAPFCDLAYQLVQDLPRNPERTVALRKLLEAKDCAVRALIYKS